MDPEFVPLSAKISNHRTAQQVLHSRALLVQNKHFTTLGCIFVQSLIINSQLLGQIKNCLALQAQTDTVMAHVASHLR